MTGEKRKHIRVDHRATVHFVTGDRSIQGSSINISRNGMQVVVNLPQSHETIESITFDLPASEHSIRVPCRLVRTEQRGAEEQTVGVEFLPDAQTPLLLIEKYIEDSARRCGEARQLPRTACRILGVETDVEGMRVLSVDNLSTDGVLFTYSGKLEPGDALSLVLKPPEDVRPLRLRGTIVYVLRHAFRDAWTAGMRVEGLTEVEHRRLCNLVLTLSSGSTVREMYDHLDALPADAGFRIEDGASIISLLSGLCTWRVPLSMLLANSPTIRECALVEVRDDEGTLELQILDGQLGSAATPECAAYVGFPLDGASHYFKSRVASGEADRLVLELPASVFRSDKRSYGRKSLASGSRVLLAFDAPGSGGCEVEGTLLDISRRGFLCEVDASLDTVLRDGDQVRYKVDAGLGLDSRGQIRHTEVVHGARGASLRVGIEAGIARGQVRSRTVDTHAWSGDRPFVRGGIEAPSHPEESVLVCYRARDGKQMRALLNCTGSRAGGPVVVVPPSYGKRKESYAPLVATLLANFRRLGKPLVTLRYDGVNRPGESHNDAPKPRRGYEMLSYRISQGLQDLEATLDFVRNHPALAPERVILLTFSMSALDARRYLATRSDSGVSLWISCMGVPCTQSTLRNILGGIDIIGNQRLGVPNGVMGLLGHLVKTDILAQDVLDSKYAYITDARADLARIETPILWICGQHDKWVDPEEVEDLMSVEAPGAREILSIPSGHNLHTSDDAIRTYKLITAEMYEHLHGERIEPCDPCKPEMLRSIANERERLEDRAPESMQEYWRGYLIGNERNPVGYDFYANLEEFCAFLGEQVELLDLGEREVIADLGCGTGLFLETLLRALASRTDSRPEYRICALDLVPEALEKTRAKCERVLRAGSHLSRVDLSYHQANLEPSTLLPLSRFLQAPDTDWSCLRGKIRGLYGDTLDRLLAWRSPQLDALMRGAVPTQGLLAGLDPALSRRDLKVVFELNRAARLLLDRIADEDLRAPGVRAAGRPLRTTDLRFEVLQLGDTTASAATGIPEGPFTKIVASLFISYLQNPEYLIEECHRLLEPGGTLLISSMRPDSDISTIFTNYIGVARSMAAGSATGRGGARGVTGALAMLNEAATLFELEEHGSFRFYADHELVSLLETAGFTDLRVRPSLGEPYQACIAIGRKAI